MAGKNNLTICKIHEISQMLKKYTDVVNHPSDKTNIRIIKDELIFTIDGVIEKRIKFSTDRMKLDDIVYDKNVFSSSDTKLSPIEADRHRERWDRYYTCDFMKFMPQILLVILFFDFLPDVVEAIQIMLYTYTEVVPAAEILTNRHEKLKVKDVNYKHVGKQLVFTDGRELENKIIRFKSEYKSYFEDSIPYNEFTTEHICNRLFKAYGSCVRDVYDPLRLYEKGVDNVEYSLFADLDGIDLIINGVPVYAYSNTVGGNNMRKFKKLARHPKLSQKVSISIVKGVENVNGLHVFSDEVLLDIAKAAHAPVFSTEMSYAFYG